MANGQPLGTLRPKQESRMDSTILVKCKFTVSTKCVQNGLAAPLTLDAFLFRAFWWEWLGSLESVVPLRCNKKSIFVYILHVRSASVILGFKFILMFPFADQYKNDSIEGFVLYQFNTGIYFWILSTVSHFVNPSKVFARFGFMLLKS